MECTVFQRLKLLSRLQKVDIANPHEAFARLERVTTHTRSADDRERLAPLIRVTTEVTGLSTAFAAVSCQAHTAVGHRRPAAPSALASREARNRL